MTGVKDLSKKQKENNLKKSSSGKNVKKSRSKQKVRSPKKKINYARNKGDPLRRAKYRANRLLGMNCYQAARQAGYSEATARHHGYKIERVENVSIAQALEDAGATNKIMARELVRVATSAMKRQRCTFEVKQDEDGEMVIDDQAAELVPDEHLRIHTWELIGKFKKQLGSNAIPPITDYDRLVIVVERKTQGTIPNAREGNPVNPEAGRRIRLTD